MKTKEELEQLKTECESLSKKLNELTEDELNEVIGGYLKLKCNFKENSTDKKCPYPEDFLRFLTHQGFYDCLHCPKNYLYHKID